MLNENIFFRIYNKLNQLIPVLYLLLSFFVFLASGYFTYLKIYKDAINSQETHLIKMVNVYNDIFINYNLSLDALETKITYSNKKQPWTSQELISAYNRKIPTIRAILLFDKQGKQTAATFGTFTNVNISDRQYFINAAKGTYEHWYGPYNGRNDGALTFALARRLEDTNKSFNGLISLTGEPKELDRICKTFNFNRALITTLVETNSNKVISYCVGNSKINDLDKVGIDSNTLLPNNTKWHTLSNARNLQVGIAISEKEILNLWKEAFLHQFIFFFLSIFFALLAIITYLTRITNNNFNKHLYPL